MCVREGCEIETVSAAYCDECREEISGGNPSVKLLSSLSLVLGALLYGGGIVATYALSDYYDVEAYIDAPAYFSVPSTLMLGIGAFFLAIGVVGLADIYGRRALEWLRGGAA